MRNTPINTNQIAAHSAAQESDATTQWVTFQIAGETYGIDVTQVQEVLREIDITPVPGSPYFVLGIINLRGNVVTVADPKRKFDLPSTEITDASRIVITETERQVIGILVDSISEVVYLHEDEIENTPNVGNDEPAKCIHGVSNRDNEMLILIDLNKLFYDENANQQDNIFI